MNSYNYPIKKLVYSGKYKREISMPMGGIGTGCIGLASNGALVDFEIFNRPNKLSSNRVTFFAIKAEKDGKICDIRALQKDYKYQEITADEVVANLYVNTFMVGPNMPLKVQYKIKRK